jgi:hypothetical protein
MPNFTNHIGALKNTSEHIARNESNECIFLINAQWTDSIQYLSRIENLAKT